MNGLRIGALAKQAGVGIDTVRYYERRRLIASPPRLASGYRVYPADTAQRLRFIQRGKALGFTLQEIGELLALRYDRKAKCVDVRRRTQHKLDDVNARVADLRRLRGALEKLLASCTRNAPSSECPILEALETPDEAPAR